MSKPIPFSPPDITEEEIKEVSDALRSGWITTGPRTKQFEKNLCEYLKVDNCVCLNSATAAEELNFRILGIGEGDEVIVPAYTYTASASAAIHCGATVKFVDSQIDSVEMDYQALENAITEKTKAIVPVDLGGVPCDYDTIYKIVEKKKSLFHPANDIQKADKAKRDLISNVSHDLRTPLTMIGGYGEMMIDLPEEKTDENIQVIVDETKRLNALVNDLLDMSRLQDGRIVLHKEVFDISALLKTQLQKYDVYRMQEGYTIESELLDTIYVNADKKRIEQVINNFLNNAVNYGGEAKHIIVREIKKENTVRIEVQDFGEGIDSKDLDNIWDRYYKVDKEHVRVANGSGIGLNIVKQLLELHGVPYGVKSSKGKGSTFYFEMPIEKGNQ